MGLILPSRFTRQPQYVVPLDRQNIFGRAVDAAFSFGGSTFDLVSWSGPTTNTATIVANGKGRALQFSGAQTFLFTKANAYSGPYMIAAIVQPDTASGGVGNVASGSANGVGYSWQLRYNNADWEFYHRSDAADVLAGEVGGVTAFKPAILVALWDGANIKLFRDGVLKATTVVTTQPRQIDRISLGYDSASGGQFFNGSVNDALFFRGTFTDSDAIELSKNVYQTLKAPARKLWFSADAAEGSTGTVATINADDASAASGTTTVTGTLGTTNANDTSAASGTTAVIGTLAITNPADTASASGAAGAVEGAASGGSFYEAPRIERHRTVQQERERLGIITKQVKKVLVAVAKASVANEATDAQAGGLLASALAMKGLQPAPQYEQFMQQERDRILSRDIDLVLRIRKRQYELEEDEREAEMLLM